MDDLITDGRYSWVRLGLTPFVATVINAGMWAIIVIMPTIKAEYGGTRAMVSPPTTAIRFATSSIVWCLQGPPTQTLSPSLKSRVILVAKVSRLYSVVSL